MFKEKKVAFLKPWLKTKQGKFQMCWVKIYEDGKWYKQEKEGSNYSDAQKGSREQIPEARESHWESHSKIATFLKVRNIILLAA